MFFEKRWNIATSFNNLSLNESEELPSQSFKKVPIQKKYNFYQEKILFIPNFWNALAPPNNLPEIKKNLKDSSEFVFCSFNNFQKLSETTINVWSKILKNSDAKILLKNSLIGGEDLKNNISLDENSNVLVIGCEGDADEILYKKLLDDGKKELGI